MTVPIKARELRGKWGQGYVLDWHVESSQMTGHNDHGHPVFDTKRTPLGELVFRLKYRNGFDGAAEIAETATAFLAGWSIKPDLLIPVPPSNTHRRRQPVYEVAKQISSRCRIPLDTTSLIKIRSTSQLKNISDNTERITALSDAFTANEQTLRGKAILLFDDVYRSGATLNAVTEILKTEGQTASVFVLILTETRGA